MTGSLKVKTSLSTDLIEFNVLMSLSTGPKGVSEIAKEFNVSKNPQDLKRLRTKVSRLLRKLVSKGLVVKDDGRYRLTAKGIIYIIFGSL
jgi:predicted transcriptional regulator